MFLTTKPGAGCHEVARGPVHVAHLRVVAVRIEVAEVVDVVVVVVRKEDEELEVKDNVDDEASVVV